jgi:hypothetical protein
MGVGCWFRNWIGLDLVVDLCLWRWLAVDCVGWVFVCGGVFVEPVVYFFAVCGFVELLNFGLFFAVYGFVELVNFG